MRDPWVLQSPDFYEKCQAEFTVKENISTNRLLEANIKKSKFPSNFDKLYYFLEKTYMYISSKIKTSHLVIINICIFCFQFEVSCDFRQILF